MKKILSLLLCLLLLSALAMPVFAAQTAQMTVTASKTVLKPGDKVTFTVSLSKVEKCTLGGFMFQFDKNVFSYESGKSHAGLKGFIAGVSTAANKVAGYFMNGKATLEGELFSVTLKVLDNAAPGTYTVTGRPSLTTSEQVECTAVGAQVVVKTDGAAPDKSESPAPDKEKPTLPKESLPSVPVPLAPPDTDTDAPDSNALPDTGSDPQTTRPTVNAVGQPEVNHHVEGAPEKPSFPWWIVVVIAVVAAGGATFLILESRKTKNGR